MPREAAQYRSVAAATTNVVGTRMMYSLDAATYVEGNQKASALLDGGGVIIGMTTVGGSVAAFPSSWNPISLRNYDSFANFQAAVNAGTVGAYVKIVRYDDENWAGTPSVEQNSPGYYMQQFCQLAHQIGRLCFTAPAVDLMNVLTPHYPTGNYHAYIDYGMPAIAAKYADYYDIQAQGSQNDGSLYAWFVSAAAAQARSANPNVIIYAGLSTYPSGTITSTSQIVNAIRATDTAVSGYWFNTPNDYELCMAVDVLLRLAGYSFSTCKN